MKYYFLLFPVKIFNAWRYQVIYSINADVRSVNLKNFWVNSGRFMFIKIKNYRNRRTYLFGECGAPVLSSYIVRQPFKASGLLAFSEENNFLGNYFSSVAARAKHPPESYLPSLFD